MKLKFLFLSLTLIFCIQSKSQNIESLFETDSIGNIEIMIQKLIGNSPRNFKLHDIEDHLKARKPFLNYRYKGASIEQPDSVKLIVSVYQSMKGENTDLELSGVPHYEIKVIWGKLLELTQIWKIFDPEATMESISKKGISIYKEVYDSTGRKRKYRIRKDLENRDKGMWLIERTW